MLDDDVVQMTEITTKNDTVYGRIEHAPHELSPTQLAAILLFAGALAFALMFLSEPLAHDAMHNFRHAAGIVCH